MSIQATAPAYILGNAPTAELRLELLNELTSTPFVEAMRMLPSDKMQIRILGCGSGHLEARLAEIFTNSHFIGIDLSTARLTEARARVKALSTNNTFEYIQADLTTMSPTEIPPGDILISRFVLSHLPDAESLLNRFLSIVKPRGYVCLEEGASDCKDYFCNTQNSGFESFVKLVPLQMQAQNSRFDIGFRFLSDLPGTRLHYHITHPILLTARHKSIIRLGVEDAKATILKDLNVDELVRSLLEFEQDKKTFALYMRFLAMIIQLE